MGKGRATWAALLLCAVLMLALIALVHRRRQPNLGRVQSLVDDFALAQRSTVILLVDPACDPPGSTSSAGVVRFKTLNQVLPAVRQTPEGVPILLVMHVRGGYTDILATLAAVLSGHRGPVLAMIPYYALSGGTLLALAADEVWMGPSASVGHVDPQLSVAAPGGAGSAEDSYYAASDTVASRDAAVSLRDRVTVAAARRAIETTYATTLQMLEGRGAYGDDHARLTRLAGTLAAGKEPGMHSAPIDKRAAVRLLAPAFRSDREPPSEVYAMVDAAISGCAKKDAVKTPTVYTAVYDASDR